jgi:hypothetical protein
VVGQEPRDGGLGERRVAAAHGPTAASAGVEGVEDLVGQVHAPRLGLRLGHILPSLAAMDRPPRRSRTPIRGPAQSSISCFSCQIASSSESRISAASVRSLTGTCAAKLWADAMTSETPSRVRVVSAPPRAANHPNASPCRIPLDYGRLLAQGRGKRPARCFIRPLPLSKKP